MILLRNRGDRPTRSFVVTRRNRLKGGKERREEGRGEEKGVKEEALDKRGNRPQSLASAITIVPLFDFDACTKQEKEEEEEEEGRRRGYRGIQKNFEPCRRCSGEGFDRQRSKTGVIGFEESDRGSGIDEDTSDRQ